MYTLEISDESLKKLEKIGKEFSGMDNKIVKEALRKALNYAKKEEKKFIKFRYSLQPVSYTHLTLPTIRLV